MARRITRARARQSALLLVLGGVLMMFGAAVAAIATEWAQGAVAFVVGAYFIGTGVQRFRDADDLED